MDIPAAPLPPAAVWIHSRTPSPRPPSIAQLLRLQPLELSLPTSQSPDFFDHTTRSRASSLFRRVKAIISSSSNDNDGALSDEREELREEDRPQPADVVGILSDNTSYFGDDSSSLSARVFKDKRVELEDGVYLSSDSEEVVLVGRGPGRSVASSMVNEPMTIRPQYSHASDPEDGPWSMKAKKMGRRTSSRALGRVSPSILSGVATVGARGPDVDGSSIFSAEMTPTRPVTAGVLRKEAMRSRSATPILHDAQAYAYSSESETRTPDLFPERLNLDSPVKKPADTPINTIASPPPLIGVIPATPYVLTSAERTSGEEAQSAEMECSDTESEVARAGTTMIAHTGASSLRSTLIGHTGAPSTLDSTRSTAEKGTMTEHEFDYEVYSDDDELERKPPTPKTSLLLNRPKYRYSTDEFHDMSSYTESEVQYKKIPTQEDSLYDVFAREGRMKEETASRGRSRVRSGSQPRSQQYQKLPDADPVVSSSFTRIIGDLEDMLNQALELAGRAVRDTSVAMEERDASIRSLQESRQGSAHGRYQEIGPVHSNGTRQSSKPRNIKELTMQDDGGASTDRAAEDKKPKVSSAPKLPPEVMKKLNNASTVAVYRDTGETTEDSGKSKKKHVEEEPPVRKLSQRIAERRSSLKAGSSAKAAKSHTTDKSKRSRASTLPGHPEKYRMEVGRSGEIVLVRLPPSTNSNPSPPTSGSQRASNSSIAKDDSASYKGGWEWSLWGKRLAACVVCAIVGLLSWILGNYAAEASAIEVHLNISPRVSSLGNAMLYLGVAVPVLILWPLPLLHGRKPYLLFSIALLIPLQLPQALSLPPYTSNAEEKSMPLIICLLFFRSLSGPVLGFAFINAFTTLLDLFGADTGACCRGGVITNNCSPMEGENQWRGLSGGEDGVRLGSWLGMFVWMLVAAPGVAFLFGQITISGTTPSWGFWITMIITALLLFVLILMPEVRPPWKRVRVVRDRSRYSPRRVVKRKIVDRGEITMVVNGISAKWWWEEVWAGLILSWTMMKQGGYLMMAMYVGFVFGFSSLLPPLMAHLLATDYDFTAISVGCAILAPSLCALAAVPLQLTYFYRSNFRHHSVITMHNRNYGHQSQGQHPYRGALFSGGFVLPLGAASLAISATGPPTHFMIPIFFSCLVAFSATLVISEAHVLLLDHFDISDLPEPALTTPGTESPDVSRAQVDGRHDGRHDAPDDSAEGFNTCHPTITSGVVIFHSLGFFIAAISVGVSPVGVESIGVRGCLAVYAVIVVAVTLGLIMVLWRGKTVRMFSLYEGEGRRTVWDADDPEGCGAMLKVSALQMGKLTRWSEVSGMEYWEEVGKQERGDG